MTSALWRMRVAVLWIFVAVSMSAHMLLALTMPGMLDGLMEGRVGEMEITGGAITFFAVFWIVPLTMAFLTLTLRESLSKSTNLGLGVLVTAMWVWDFVEHLVAGEALFGISLLTGATILAGLGILWHALKWPAAQSEKLPVDEATRTSAERVPVSH